MDDRTEAARWAEHNALSDRLRAQREVRAQAVERDAESAWRAFLFLKFVVPAVVVAGLCLRVWVYGSL